MSAVLNITVSTATSAMCGCAVCGQLVSGQQAGGAMASDQLKATLTPYGSLQALLHSGNGLSATITQGPMMISDCPDYEGDYVIRPAIDAQELETKGKRMKTNLLVQEIPYAEVSNTTGGTTVTIG